MQLLTISDICKMTRYSRWTIWRHRRRYDDFPKPIGEDGDDPRWPADEIERWYLNRRQAR